MRALTPDEAQVIRWFAARAGESARGSLLEDLEDTMIEETRDEHVTLRFQRWGHPLESFIDSYLGPSAIAQDLDGANLALTLGSTWTAVLLSFGCIVSMKYSSGRRLPTRLLSVRSRRRGRAAQLDRWADNEQRDREET